MIVNDPNTQNVIANELATLAERLRRSTVQVQGRRNGAGSGVIWQANGVIVTNAHVVGGEQAIVELADGRTFDATITARDPRRDLAALQVAATDLPAVEIGDANTLRTGELVFAVGNPLGLVGALTTGIVAATAHAEGRSRWVQADIELAPGNSGGILADAWGRVVGINSMIVNGLAYAVPSNAVTTFLQRKRPYLGVTLRPVAVPMAGARVAGLLVLEVVNQSLAEQIGLLPGDLLVGINGTLFRSGNELSNQLNDAQPGERFLLNLIRNGEFGVCEVAIEHEPSEVKAA